MSVRYLFFFFARCTEHQRTNGGVSREDERAGGTGQGDSHAAGELPLPPISYPSRAFVTFIAPARNLQTSELSSVPAKRPVHSHRLIVIWLFPLRGYSITGLGH